MNIKRLFIICFLISNVVSSCSKGYGTSYIQKNLTVYYTNKNDLKLAKSLADYWFTNGMIGEKKQAIRLFNLDNKNRQVQLIALKKIDANSLKFEEIEEIQKLENDLNKTIFKDNKVDVVICDSRFNVTNDLNY
jgi:hypothetical protein